MTDARPYRDGAQRVRTDARAKLAALRADRAAGKFRVVEGGAPTPSAPIVTPTSSPGRASFQPSARARAFAEASATLAAAPRIGSACEVEATDSTLAVELVPRAPRASRAATAAARKAAQAEAVIADTDPAPPRPRRTRAARPVAATIGGDEHAAPDAFESPESPATAPGATPAIGGADTDLATLPGAGPGLVWLLTNAGYGSLADLAAADADALRDKLGLIGLLVNLEGWISFAAEATRPAPAPKASRRRGR